jgi:hypothetical protein
LKTKILKYFLAFFTIVIAFFTWLSVDRSIHHVIDISTWGMPIIAFSFFFTLIYVDVIIFKRKYILEIIFLATLFLSFIFTQNFWHLVILCVSNLFIFWGVARIRKDLELNVKISLLKSIRTGSTLLILAISLVIASQYYFAVKNFDSAHLIPQFKLTSMTGNFTSKIIAWLNPDFKKIEQNNLTVDQFILQAQEEQNQKSSSDMNSQVDQMIELSNPKLTVAQKNLLKVDALQKANDASAEIKSKQDQMIIQEGRKKFSELTGTELTGNEKVSDIFSDIVNRKINQYFNSDLTGTEKSSPLPIIMTIGLFLTIWPLGSLLNIIWIGMAEFLIWIFLKLEFIHIKKIPVEMEVIE